MTTALFSELVPCADLYELLSLIRKYCRWQNVIPAISASRYVGRNGYVWDSVDSHPCRTNQRRISRESRLLHSFNAE